MSKVAVILPTFKPGDYLKRNFDSLENQTLSRNDFCVYIGLNGPRAEYEEFVCRLLQKYNFNYKFFYFAKPGVSFCRNKLIDLTVEEYLVFIDDDDVVSNNYLDSLLKSSSTNVMGISNIVNFKGEITNLFPNYIGVAFKKLSARGYDHFKYRKYFSSPCAKMLHRDMIGDLRFDESLAVGEDGYFMASISKNISFLNKTESSAIYFVNVRVNSSSRKAMDKRYELNRIIYLLKCYVKMLVRKGYNKKFIMSRVVATIFHLKRLVK